MVFQFKPTLETFGSLKGKTVIVTGGSAESCLVFARLQATLIIAGRNKEKCCNIINEMKASTGNENIEFLQMDLSDLSSVKAAAQKLIARKGLSLDILLNNAGIAALPGITKDGFEIQFATNHLGPFLFTELLTPLMNKSSSRIILVSSKAAGEGKKYNFETDIRQEDSSIVKLQPYGNSKLANALYAKKLSQILKGTGITTYSLHPGVVATDIWKAVPWPFQSFIKLFMLSEEEGAYTQLFCALDPSVAKESGLFYDDCKSREINPIMNDQEYIDELYAKSRELVKDFL